MVLTQAIISIARLSYPELLIEIVSVDLNVPVPLVATLKKVRKTFCRS